MPLTPFFTTDLANPQDDSAYELAIPFSFYFNGVDYGNGANGGIWWSSNNYLCFGGGDQTFPYNLYVDGLVSIGNGILFDAADQMCFALSGGVDGTNYRLHVESANRYSADMLPVLNTPPRVFDILFKSDNTIDIISEYFSSSLNGEGQSGYVKSGILTPLVVVSHAGTATISTSDNGVTWTSNGTGAFIPTPPPLYWNVYTALPIYIQTTAPTGNIEFHAYWYSVDNPTIVKYYNGFNWFTYNNIVVSDTTPPVGVSDSLWYNPSTSTLYISSTTVPPIIIVPVDETPFIPPTATWTVVTDAGIYTSSIKKNYQLTTGSSTTSINNAALDIYDAIKKVAIAGGFTVKEALTTLWDGTSVYCSDIYFGDLALEDTPRYYLAIPVISDNTMLPTLGSYRGLSLEVSPTFTSCLFEDLNRSSWSSGTYFTGTPKLNVYANAAIGLIWYSISFGDDLFVYFIGSPVPRSPLDTQGLIDSYPKYGVYYRSSLLLCYGVRLIAENDTATFGRNALCSIGGNSLINTSYLGFFDCNGGVSNAPANITYSITPIVQVYFTYSDPLANYSYSQFFRPAIFAPLQTIRGIFTSSEIANLSSFEFLGDTFVVLRDDLFRKEYNVPSVAYTMAVLAPSTGFDLMSDWS